MSQITALLHERHHIRADDVDDFNIRDMSEIIKALGSMSQMMGGLLMIVAMISLIVGGVGIMNIMLVSVTERTKEIGLRMAVGARSHQILRQFLIEAIVLCLLGGIVGIVLGRATALWCGTSCAGPLPPRTQRSWQPLPCRPRSESPSVFTRLGRPPASTRSMRCDMNERHRFVWRQLMWPCPQSVA